MSEQPRRVRVRLEDLHYSLIGPPGAWSPVTVGEDGEFLGWLRPIDERYDSIVAVASNPNGFVSRGPLYDGEQRHATIDDAAEYLLEEWQAQAEHGARYRLDSDTLGAGL